MKKVKKRFDDETGIRREDSVFWMMRNEAKVV